jgi:hypothetical protein
MALKTLPDREYVRECLDYDPATGIFRWKERPLAHFQDARSHRAANTRRTGNIAGTILGNGYLGIRIDGETYRAHRLAFLLVHGEPVPDEIDHRNGDRLDNWINNLREATRSLNNANAKTRKNSTSGIKGVFRFPDGRYRANISHGGKNHYLGTFDTIEQAAAARNEAAERIYGDFARH